MNPWRGLKDLPRDMWLIAVGALINRAGTMVLPFLAIYLSEGLGEKVQKAGLVIAFYGLGALVTAPFVGKLADKIGSLRLMKISLIFSALMLFIYSFVQNYYLISIVTFVWAIINESFRPASLSLISHIVPANLRRPAYALNRLAVNLGMSIGPVLGGFLVLVNFSLIFYVDALTSLAAGLFFIFAPWQRTDILNRKFNTKDDTHLLQKQNSAFKDLRFIYYLFALLPVPIVYMQHQAAMPLYLVQDLKYLPSVFGILFTINTLLIILIEFPLNNSIKHWTDKKALSIGALLIGIGFGGMAFSKDIPSLVITIIIWTFGEMILFPASSAYISEIAPENKRGEYMGLFQMNFSLAVTVGPWAGTIVLEHFGAQILWISCFLLCLVSVFMFLRIKENKKDFQQA